MVQAILLHFLTNEMRVIKSGFDLLTLQSLPNMARLIEQQFLAKIYCIVELPNIVELQHIFKIWHCLCLCEQKAARGTAFS